VLLVAHLSRTPCAGAIFALAGACQEHDQAPSRFISCGGEVGNLSFPYDLTWHNAEALSVLAFANVLVLHNYLDAEDQPILDFLEGDPSKRVAAYYHSHPDNCNLTAIGRGVPAFVVNQFQSLVFEERGLKHHPIRNVIRFDRADWPAWRARDPHLFKIGWSPTTRSPQLGVRGDRQWYDTKGYEPTNDVLEQLGGGKGVELVRIEGVPYTQAIDWKAECDVLIDEIATGSFHRSTLEGLALGVPTIVNIAPELDARITELAEGDEMPVLRCNSPEQLGAKLEELATMKRKNRRQLGVAGREWMERHWHPRAIAAEFADLCTKLPTWAELNKEVGSCESPKPRERSLAPAPPPRSSPRPAPASASS
jgi:hypothetical protein